MYNVHTVSWTWCYRWPTTTSEFVKWSSVAGMYFQIRRRCSSSIMKSFEYIVSHLVIPYNVLYYTYVTLRCTYLHFILLHRLLVFCVARTCWFYKLCKKAVGLMLYIVSYQVVATEPGVINYFITMVLQN